MSQDEDHGSLGQFRQRRLLHGEITSSFAKQQDANIPQELIYQDEKIRYFAHLYRNRHLIEVIVARNLGLASGTSCHLAEVEDWIDGSFNVCIRVDVDERDQTLEQQVMVRFPLPYRVDEETCPGNWDENIRCKTGRYAWLQENCPENPIPRLYVFGFSNRKTVRIFSAVLFVAVYTSREYASFCPLNPLGYLCSSFYVSHRIDEAESLGMGYILIEYIKPSQGRMLSDTWEDGRLNSNLRANLFRSLSHITITLAQIPLPRIDSCVG
ncbi:hypothetical protein N7462_000972 [Penicillium macrosclerotiorum]|uniref:uncharacterized protein n=1 Tax=Penicillium macrosclerotiorum TaxID=303699 RepID=UPI002546B772|nr:uncharacterized protein N7462_000972 [Penicillium macrosclerotiorum]KAJ5698967.1 hypothetical protein N7462_000972 [Penicillium macrosclerotiorum]